MIELTLAMAHLDLRLRICAVGISGALLLRAVYRATHYHESRPPGSNPLVSKLTFVRERTAHLALP